MQRVIYALTFILMTLSLFGQDCPDEILSTVCFNLDECHSTFASSSQSDYSEFTGSVDNGVEGSIFSVVGDHLYVNDPNTNTHSCTLGNNGTAAMCISSSDLCMFENDADKAVRFDIEVAPGIDGTGSISCLSFYEAAPQTFSWINGTSGLNDYPQYYGVRVTVDGEEVFREEGIPTSNDWSLENFDFKDIPEFTVSTTTVFSFELLAYCTVGNGGFVNAWDLEDIKIFDKGPHPIYGGEITFNNGDINLDICEDQDFVFTEVLNNNGPNSVWVVTNNNGNIISVSSNPIDVSMYASGMYSIQHMSYDDFECESQSINTDLEVVSIGSVLLDLEDAECSAIAEYFVDPVPPTGIFNLPFKEFVVNIAEGGYYTFNPSNSCDYVFNLYPLNGFDISQPCDTNNLLTFGGYSATNGGIEQVGGTYLEPGQYQMIICSIDFGCTDAIVDGAVGITCSNIAPGMTVDEIPGCYDLSNTIKLTIVDSPVISVNNIQITSCGYENGSATANATGGQGNYSFIWSNGDTGPMISGVGAGSYTVTVTDDLGCTDEAIVSIGGSTSPILNLTSVNTTCNLSNGSASGSSTSGTGSYTYVWSTGSTGSTISNLSSGTYTVTVTDGSGCTDEGSVTISGSSSPVVSIAGNDTSCGLNDGYAEASTTGGTGSYSYVWSNGDTDGAITFVSAGTYTVTVTDGNGCTDEGSVTISGSSSPVVAVSGVSTTCGIDNGTASASTTGGTGSYSYVWSNGDTDGAITFVSAGTYTVTVTDGSGCTDEGSVTISGSSSPVVAVSGVSTTCGINNGTASASTTGGTGTYSYVWSTGSVGSTVSNLSAGTYTVTVTDGSGCTDEGSVTISGSSSPEVSIAGNDTSCGLNDGYAEASTTGGTGSYSYVWSNGDTDGAITFVSAGTYTVTVTDGSGCTDEASVTISGSSSPVVAVSGVSTTCGINNGTASASTTGGTGTYSYVWSTGSAGSTVSNLSSGTYTVTVTDGSGCTDEGSVTINGSSSPVVAVSGVSTTCGINNGTASASTTGGTGTYSYVWSTGSVGSTVSNLSSGTYTVTVTDGSGCTDEGSVTISGSSSPVVSIAGNDTSCGLNDGYAEASSTGGTGSYSYVWSNGDTDGAITFVSAGTYTVTVTDGSGCTDEASVTISDSSSPVVAVSGVSTTCGIDNGTASVSATSGTGTYSYLWSTGSVGSTVSNLSAGTYTVTVTDGSGCTDEASVTISGSSSPVVAVSGVSTTCGINNGTASASTTGGTGTYSYVWSTGSVGSTVSNLSSGTYTVTVTDGSGCTDEGSVTISGSSSPVVAVSGVSTTCGIDNGTASASTTGGTGTYSYVWSTGSVGSTVSNLSAGTYTVTVTDGSGCTDEGSVTISGSSSPVVAVSGVSTTCGINNGTASVSTTGGTGTYSYVWSTGSTGSTISNLSSGTYTVTVTDGSGCTDEGSVTISGSSSPVVSIAGNDTSCGLNDGYAEASSTGGTGSYSYVWSNGDTDGAITFVSAGTYTVTVTDGSGCTDEGSVTISGSSSPVVAVSGVSTTCGINNGTASVSTTGGTGTYSYVWSTGSTGSTISNLSSGTYTVTVTDGSGCTDEGSVTISGSSSPVVAVSGVSTTCGINNGTASASTTGGTGTYSYLWSTGSVGSTVSNLSAGTYTVTVTDGSGCTDEGSVTISGSSSPVVSIAGNDTSCGLNDGYAEASSTGGTGSYSYVWSNGDTDGAITFVSAGTYTVTVTDGNGCTDEASVTISGSSSPVVAVSGVSTTCGINNGTASVSTTGGTGTYSYVWSTGSTGSTISNLSSGTYTVTVTDGSGCTDEGSVTINGSSSPVVAVSGVSTTCGLENGSMSASATSGAGGYTFAWSNGVTGSVVSGIGSGTYTVTVTDNVGCTDVASVTIGTSNGTTISIVHNNTSCGLNNGFAEVTATGGSGTYLYAWNIGDVDNVITNVPAGTYTVTVSDDLGCTDEVSVTISGSSSPVVAVSGVSTTCGIDNGTASVSATSGTGTYSYVWSTGSMGSTVSNLSSGTYTVTVTDAAGCTDEESITINSSSSPIVTLNGIDAICGENNGSVSASSTSGSGSYSYVWSTGSTSSSITNLGAGIYSVTVTDNEGCTDVASVTIDESNGPTVTVAGTSTSCGLSNGYAEASTSGGSGNYTYLWSNGDMDSAITNVAAGTYTVTVTDDQGCIDVGTIVIGSSNSPVVSINEVNTSCGLNNGSASASTVNGTGNYSYSWSNGSTGATINDLASGIYTVTVTDGAGCTDESSVTINGSNSPVVSINEVNTSCGLNNGSASASTVNGTGNYTYSWSNGSTGATVNDLASGIYTVTVTDGVGCTDAESITINSSSTPLLNVIVVTDSSCGFNNGYAEVNATGGSGGYTYLWSNGDMDSAITNVAAGTFTVTVTDSQGCTDEASVTIGASSNLSIDMSGVNEICTDASGSVNVSIVSGNGNYTYMWSNGASASSISGLSEGTYSVTVTDGHGCTADQSITLSNETLLVVTASGTDTCCALDNGTATVNVQCPYGTYSINWSNGETTQDINNLSPGTYTVTVTDSANNTGVGVVVVNSSTAPVVNVTSTSTTCGQNDGSVQAIASSGTPGYTYEWNTGATTNTINGLSAGTYIVTVTDAKDCVVVETVTIDGSINPNAGSLTGGPFHFCIDGIEDYVSGIIVTGVTGTNTTYVITNESGIILGLPSSLSDLENVNFEGAGTGTCYIYHVAYESGVTGLNMGASINNINGCYDIDGSIEVVREGVTTVTPTLSFDMDACNAGTTFGEFTSSIVNYNGCTAMGVVGGNLTAGFSHSCTPGVSNNGMCFTANLSCTYNPSTTQKMIIPISVVPGADGTGNLSGISFYEQAPQTFVWTDGNSGVNNYPTLYSIRVLKDGVMVYEIADNPTSLGWSQANFSFLSNPEFTVTQPTTFTIELIPYCASGNTSTTISIWDIDELEIYSECDITPAAGTLSGGPYDICIDGLADYITDITLTGAAGINSSFIITDAIGNIIGLPATFSDLSAVNFDNAGSGTCYIYHVSYDSGMIGLAMGNNVFQDLYGCYDLSNSIEVVRNDCGSIMDIYPNPTNGQLTMDLHTRTFEQVSYSIIDNLGRVVSTRRISDNKSRTLEIDLSNMPAGQYFIRSTVDGFRKTMPIVIVK